MEITEESFPEVRSRQEMYLQDIIKSLSNESISDNNYPDPLSRQEAYLQIIISKLRANDPNIEIKTEDIEKAVNKYFEQNPIQLGATENQAKQIEENKKNVASLKAETGSLKEDKVDKPSATDDGKIPRAKEGGVEWVEAGQPTDEQTNSAVSSWLNEHPEATTTVLDGSINEYKFTSTLRKKKANYYISVEKMKEDTSLITDIVCVTLGYYELNDGGGSTYKVRKKIATDIDDGGSIIFLNDELVAELIVENETVNVKQFGAHGNSVSDDYSYFNNAIDFSKKNGFEIKIPVGTFIISKQLNLKSVVGLKIIGSNDAPERYATKIIFS